MSLKIESYKLVGRTYLGRLLDQTKRIAAVVIVRFALEES